MTKEGCTLMNDMSDKLARSPSHQLKAPMVPTGDR